VTQTDQRKLRVVVTGGRDFDGRVTVFEALDQVHESTPIVLLIHGAAAGADALASEWAESRGVPAEAYPADWSQYGRAAGPVRNAHMLARRPDLLIAFPGGRGTADMVRRAKAAGVAVLKITGREARSRLAED
jgi:YspA, cpYpsA-related SLOG family